MNGRADGFSLVEALAALVLTGMLTGALVATAVAQMRLTRAMSQRTTSLEALRTASWVLAGELRRSNVRDVRAYARDSIALRTFRGRGIPCATSADGIVVRYRGDRAPNPEKDSLLLITDSGEVAVPLQGLRDSPACPPGADDHVLELDSDQVASVPALVLVFESGIYYLSGRALRYRTGAEGRQPITAEVLDGSGFVALDSTGLRFMLVADSVGSGARVAAHVPPPSQ